ncbi:hypothetical protein ACHAXT_004234 [Thalassiosira profunda]
MFASAFSPPSTLGTSHAPLKGSQRQGSLIAKRVTSDTQQNAEALPATTKAKKQKKQRSNKKKQPKKKSHPNRGGYLHFNAAKAFNSQLTKCGSVSELLSAFSEQTSSTGGGGGASSAATHMSGANKVNSVNFSTCLHRLARFAVGNLSHSQSSDVDERKRVLADPRFALLVCSMAEMAAGCDAGVTVKEGNEVIATYRAASGGEEEEGNREMQEADDVLHAIAGVSGPSGGDGHNKGKVSAEGRTAAAKAAMAQIATPRTKNAFSSRECSNLCWALAKLRMAPPCTAFQLGRVAEHTYGEGALGRPFASMEEMALDVLDSSLKVRMELFEEAKSRRQGGGGGASGTWIPELSRLAGKVLDLIAMQIIREYGTRGDSEEEARSGFNPQEMASVLWAFAKAKRGDGALFNVVAEELMKQTESEMARGGKGPKPQELSNTIWAFATAGVRGETQVELVKFIADALDEGDGQFFGYQFKPQEFSNTAWALATLHSRRSAGSGVEVIEDDGIVRILRWVAKSLVERVDSFKPQELSNTIWAFSTMGFGYDEACGTNSHNDYVHVATDNSAGDKDLVFKTLEVIAENALQRLGKFKAQELNNMAWGFARLGHRTERAEALLSGVAKELIARTWQFKPQDVGTTLWALATAEYYDLDAFCAGASRLNMRQIRSFKPQEMSNTVWALATAGFAPKYIHAFDTTLVPASKRPTKEMIASDPITECFAAVASEMMRRPHDFKDQELKDVLWSFSKAGVRHPVLFQKIAKHIVGRSGRGFANFSSQGLGNTLWSFAKQAQLSLEVIDTFGDSVKLVSTGRLAVYETTCLDNGEDVTKRLFVRAAEAGLDLGLGRFTNQDLSNTVWAYSTLGMLHSGLFRKAEDEIVSRLQSKKQKFRGQEVANILWSFATLNAQPDPSMVDALSMYVTSVCRGKNGIDERSIAKVFGQRQELANLAWSCAVIGRYPEELMNILYTGLVGTKNDPEYMRSVFKDDGLQQSSIMTLYYVQFAADVEAPDLKLSLPAGFPAGWGEDDHHQHDASDENDLINMSSSMLTLTVSKLQRDVSSTFDELGFDNILEHVIDSNEVRDEQLPQAPKEFLSIDIANIKEKVGIEVDGPGHFVRLIDQPSSAPASSQMNQFDDDGENRVNGPTILKHRLLSHLGWRIIHVPYWSFQDLGGDKEKELRYCQSLLDET